MPNPEQLPEAVIERISKKVDLGKPIFKSDLYRLARAIHSSLTDEPEDHDPVFIPLIPTKAGPNVYHLVLRHQASKQQRQPDAFSAQYQGTRTGDYDWIIMRHVSPKSRQTFKLEPFTLDHPQARLILAQRLLADYEYGIEELATAF